MAKAEITVHVADLPAVKQAMAEANRYLLDLRAERDALRAVVARVEVIAERFTRGGYHVFAADLRDALSLAVPVSAPTDSDPAATERQGEAEGAGDHV